MVLKFLPVYKTIHDEQSTYEDDSAHICQPIDLLVFGPNDEYDETPVFDEYSNEHCGYNGPIIFDKYIDTSVEIGDAGYDD